jgi:hypothetical protein
VVSTSDPKLKIPGGELAAVNRSADPKVFPGLALLKVRPAAASLAPTGLDPLRWSAARRSERVGLTGPNTMSVKKP